MLQQSVLLVVLLAVLLSVEGVLESSRWLLLPGQPWQLCRPAFSVGYCVFLQVRSLLLSWMRVVQLHPMLVLSDVLNSSSSSGMLFNVFQLHCFLLEC
jgi:hypothetical protein